MPNENSKSKAWATRQLAKAEAYKVRKAKSRANRKYYETAKGKAANKRAAEKYFNNWPGRVNRTLSQIRTRCKIKGLDYDLDAEWLLPKLKGTCELTDLPFKHIKVQAGHGKPGPKPFSPSVDRIDPKQGYTKANCRVVLYCVNAFKQTMTDEQMLKVTEKLMYMLLFNKVRNSPAGLTIWPDDGTNKTRLLKG